MKWQKKLFNYYQTYLIKEKKKILFIKYFKNFYVLFLLILHLILVKNYYYNLQLY